MNQESFNPFDVFSLIRRNKGLIVVTVYICLAIAFIAAFSLPERYKTKSILDIQSSYFRNPLISGVISEVFDIEEQKSQRAALLRLALNDQFLDRLGEKYKLFKHPPGTKMRILERQGLLMSINYFSISPTSFSVSVSAGEPMTAYLITKDVLNQMADTLYQERYKTLANARDAIQDHVTALQETLKGISNPMVSLQQSLRKELAKVEGKIMSMSSDYTDRHPDVVRLKRKAQSIQELLGIAAGKVPAGDEAQAMLAASAKAPAEEVFGELQKKLSYLNIVLEMESSRKNASYLTVSEQPSVPTAAYFPRKPLFLAAGLGVGLFLAAALVLYAEFKRGTFLSAPHASEMLGTNFLGELPRLVESERLRLLEGPEPEAIPLRLPPAANQRA